MADFDAVIIGSGNSGLACALYLARAGWRVAVLEQASEVGGAAKTAEVTLPGFHHDLHATNFTLFAASPVYRDFDAELRQLGVELLHNNFPFASAYEGGRAARVYQDAAMAEAEMARHSIKDAIAWRNAVGFFQRAAPKFLPIYFTMLPSWAMAHQLLHIGSGRPADTLALARMLLGSSRRFVDRMFETPEVRGLFPPWAFHLDYGPDVRGGAIFSFVSAISAHLRGIKIVKGGAARLMTSFCKLVEQHGGEVHTVARVVQVDVRHNRAVAVRLEGGQTIGARRAVIANVAPRLLFGKLIREDRLPSRFLSRIRTFRHAVGTFVVHLALAEPLQWDAAEDLAKFGYVHLFGSADEIERTYAQTRAGLIPSRPMLIVSQTAQVDPSRAPAGRHVLRIHARAFPAEIKGDAADSIRERRWDAAKEAVADRLVASLAEHAPNIKSAILARHVVSPVDLERDNPNLIGGDCNGGSHHLDQHYMARPAVGWSRYATPVEHLYMIGASQWPGSGVHAASGYLLARQLLSGR